MTNEIALNERENKHRPSIDFEFSKLTVTINSLKKATPKYLAGLFSTSWQFFDSKQIERNFNIFVTK